MNRRFPDEVLKSGFSYKSGKKLNGVIYLHRISDIRMAGTSRKNFELVRKLCGEERLAHVAIVTTMWEEVQGPVALAREKQLKTDNLMFKPALANGAKMFRHYNTIKTARAVIAYLLKKRQTSLRIQEEIVDRNVMLTQTTVGRTLQSEIDVLVERHERELKDLRHEMSLAVEAKDAVAKLELEEARQELERKICALRAETASEILGSPPVVSAQPIADRRRSTISPPTRPLSTMDHANSTRARVLSAPASPARKPGPSASGPSRVPAARQEPRVPPHPPYEEKMSKACCIIF